MKLSTATYPLSKTFGDERAIEILAEAGFDAIDYTMCVMKDDDFCPLNSEGYRAYAESLKKIVQKHNLTVNQAHAPFPGYRFGEEEYNARLFSRIVRSMEIASILGAPHIIVHPIACPHGVDTLKFNLDMYSRFLPYCKEYNIKIAVENMFGWNAKRDVIIKNVCSDAGDLAQMVDALDSQWFGACLDTGHVAIIGEEPQDSIRILGRERIIALHIHDNNYRGDYHLLPYEGKLEWLEILKALGEIGYDGDFTYEADGFLEGFDEPFAFEAAKFMHELGRKMISYIESAKM
ncbi:MAG: sugar phosphate isomerase/epimerase family protein [Clostridia bacterium]|nr:sugar phosphate isomerase/epimerase family protein [Clostridia bacterium]